MREIEFRGKRLDNDDWGNLGTENKISELIQNICEEYEVEEIENDVK